jgi:predicted nucleic acid-binding protein
MIVISDTSPISNLFVIGRLDLLQEIYQQIILPQAVYDELMKLKSFGYDIQEIDKLVWMVVKKPVNSQQVLLLRMNLDAGESEAIVLSQETNADLLLIDERAGAKKAKELGLKTIGLLGVLVKAKDLGMVDSLKSILEELQEKAGFWLSAKLKKEILDAVGEEDK